MHHLRFSCAIKSTVTGSGIRVDVDRIRMGGGNGGDTQEVYMFSSELCIEQHPPNYISQLSLIQRVSVRCSVCWAVMHGRIAQRLCAEDVYVLHMLLMHATSESGSILSKCVLSKSKG